MLADPRIVLQIVWLWQSSGWDRALDLVALLL